MDTQKQTFRGQKDSFGLSLTDSPARDKIKANPDRLGCPDCGFLLARILPTTQATDLLLFCRRCRKQVLVNIPKLEP